MAAWKYFSFEPHYGYCSLFFEAQREHYFGLEIIWIHVCGWKRMAVFWFSNHLICFLLDSLMIWNGTLQYIALARKCRKERLWRPFLIKGTRPEPKSQFIIKVETFLETCLNPRFFISLNPFVRTHTYHKLSDYFLTRLMLKPKTFVRYHISMLVSNRNLKYR